MNKRVLLSWEDNCSHPYRRHNLFARRSSSMCIQTSTSRVSISGCEHSVELAPLFRPWQAVYLRVLRKGWLCWLWDRGRSEGWLVAHERMMSSLLFMNFALWDIWSRAASIIMALVPCFIASRCWSQCRSTMPLSVFYFLFGALFIERITDPLFLPISICVPAWGLLSWSLPLPGDLNLDKRLQDLGALLVYCDSHVRPHTLTR